jgi:hypothetical protein
MTLELNWACTINFSRWDFTCEIGDPIGPFPPKWVNYRSDEGGSVFLIA